MRTPRDLAAAVLLAALVGACHMGGHENNDIAAGTLMRVAVAEHGSRLPPEITDEIAVSAWFREKVEFPVVPIELRPLQARFVGARVTPLHDRHAAALYYAIGFDGLTIFKFNTPAALSVSAGTNSSTDRPDAVFDVIDGYSVSVIQHQDITYVIVADIDSARLDVLVNETVFP